jgi:hypothetical protein
MAIDNDEKYNKQQHGKRRIKIAKKGGKEQTVIKTPVT